MPLRKAVGDLEGIDFSLSEVSREALGEGIATALYTKGFCAVDAAVSQVARQRALDDVAGLRASGRFQRPPEQIANGLLGLEGSAEIAELALNEEAGGGLREVDDLCDEIGGALNDLSGYLGFESLHRTAAVVHDRGPPEEPPELTERDVARWLDQFIRHKVMVVAFLGPSEGLLRLEVYSDEESEAHEVRTRPGMMVFLRPELMSHSHTSLGQAVAVSSFYIAGRPYQKRHPTGGWIVCPPAAELDAWAMERVRSLKLQVRDDADWDPEIPREWQRAMNLYYSQNATTAVHGLAGKFPGCWEAENWFRILAVGPDTVTTVPQSRWDHEFCYDPGPESWRVGKTPTSHASFMDGVDLFDNKFFGISMTESKGMDPNQRHLLEMAYESLQRMGKTKKSLMGANGSVYAGNQAFEFSFVEVPKECQGCGPTGVSGCIAANRISFVLGLKGPSMGVDTDTCSSMSALYLTVESLQQKGRGKSAEFGVGLGCATMMTPLWWHQHNAMGWMGSRGRCFVFDAGADGYIRAEACVGAAMTAHATVVDGELVADEAEHLGLIAGCCVNSNGAGARMSAPNGRAEQQLIADTVRNAGISALDVDVVETHAFGSVLGDVVEASSLARGHRGFAGEAEQEPPLAIASVKSVVGHTMECGGIVALVKVLAGAQFGVLSPGLHLREVNPHMDLVEVPLVMPSDGIDLWRRTNFSGVLSKGFGGTNGYCIAWGTVDDEKLKPAPGPQEQQLLFWPGGGGSLEPEVRPEGGYWIVGSWTEWGAPAPMEEESVGVFGYTITLGVNGWEHFHILLDGDARRVLHPGRPRAPLGTAVLGPDEDVDSISGGSWLIHGGADVAAQDSRRALPAAAGDGDTMGGSVMAAPASRGGVGERYRVRLTIAGKWRRLDWERLEPVLEPSALDIGRYYISSDWNGWVLEEMVPDASEEGMFQAEVSLQRTGGRFQILRNRDYAQVFHPSRLSQDCEDMRGPDEGGYGLDWYLGGAPGERLRISFERRSKGGAYVAQVVWRRIDAVGT